MSKRDANGAVKGSNYENYEKTSKFYDLTRVPIGLKVLQGAINEVRYFF